MRTQKQRAEIVAAHTEGWSDILAIIADDYSEARSTA